MGSALQRVTFSRSRKSFRGATPFAAAQHGYQALLQRTAGVTVIATKAHQTALASPAMAQTAVDHQAQSNDPDRRSRRESLSPGNPRPCLLPPPGMRWPRDYVSYISTVCGSSGRWVASLGHPGLERRSRERPADQVTLRGIAMPALQQAQAAFIFDALGYYLEAKVVAHFDG